MPISTYSEYQQAAEALAEARESAYDDAAAQFTDCVAHADAQFEATMAQLEATPWTTAAEFEAIQAAMVAAGDLAVQQKEECATRLETKQQEISDTFWGQLAALDDEAAAAHARLQRMIITSDALLPVAEALQSTSWYDDTSQEPAAPMFVVQSFAELLDELKRDRFTFQLMLLTNARDGALVLGAEERTISQIVAESAGPTRLLVQETFNLRGELTGAAPTDTDVLHVFGTPSIRVGWGAPPCALTGLLPADPTVPVDTATPFTAQGNGLGSVAWSTSPHGFPATGAGPTFTTTWTTPGSKQVKAACTGSTATTSVTVASVTGRLVPIDNFSGRSTKRFGVGEVVDLSFVSTPQRTADQFGGLRWYIDSGGGTLTGLGADDGTGRFTAPGTAGSVTLALKVVSGPAAGTVAAIKKIDIVEPTGAVMRQVPGTNLEHDHGTWGVYFLGEIFLRPKTVSFMFIEFREGSATAVASGFLSPGNGNVHAIGNFYLVGPGNKLRGSKVGTTDFVGGGPILPPFADGHFRWPIPWEFRIAGGSTPSAFTTANHIMTADGVGTATVEKKGAGPFRRVPSDPTSSI